MSINAIGSNYQNQGYTPTAAVEKEQEQPGGASEINRLNAEIEKAESEIKETAKEVQKAAGESVGGSSEKVQMLQNKMQMQQQAILMKQLKIKEMEAPSKSEAGKASKEPVAPPRFDQYIPGEDASGKVDNVYRLEEKDGGRTIVFNRPQELSRECQESAKQAETGLYSVNSDRNGANENVTYTNCSA